MGTLHCRRTQTVLCLADIWLTKMRQMISGRTNLPKKILLVVFQDFVCGLLPGRHVTARHLGGHLGGLPWTGPLVTRHDDGCQMLSLLGITAWRGMCGYVPIL